jgi:tRNA(fMet)-specific endonuclease VapC
MYLLDTNVCVALIGTRSLVVRRRAEAVGTKDLTVSAVSVFELWYGVAKSGRIAQNGAKLSDFLLPLGILDLDDEDARRAGTVRAELEENGSPKGPYDVLIAAQALRRALTLVTANEREFKRVRGLTVENWLTT